MKGKFILYPLLFLLFIAAITSLFMLLWNWLMPEIFGLQEINFWQSLGLVALSKILFGGVWGKHKCGCHHQGSHYSWKEKFKSKWQNMSDEDKQKWEEKFGKCKSY